MIRFGTMSMDNSTWPSSQPDQSQGKSPSTIHLEAEFSGPSGEKGIGNLSFREKMAYYVKRRLRLNSSNPSPEESFTEDAIEIIYPPKATRKSRGPATIQREEPFLWTNPQMEPEEMSKGHGVYVLVTCEEDQEDQGFLLVKASNSANHILGK